MAKVSEKDRMKQIGRELTEKLGDDPAGIEMVKELLQYHSNLRQKNQLLSEQVKTSEDNLKKTKDDLDRAMKGLDEAGDEILRFTEQARMLAKKFEDLNQRACQRKERYDKSIRMYRKMLKGVGTHTSESLLASLANIEMPRPFDSLADCEHRKELLTHISRTLHPSITCVEGRGEYLLHQDSYAPFFHVEEMLLLGVFIKWAGLRGEHVVVMGKAGEIRGPEKLEEMTAEKVIAANEIHIQEIAERFIEQLICTRKGKPERS